MLFSSTSVAIKIVEFLLDKTLWKYFDKQKSKHSVENSNGADGAAVQVLVLADLVLKDGSRSLGAFFSFISIKEYVLYFCIHLALGNSASLLFTINETSDETFQLLFLYVLTMRF